MRVFPLFFLLCIVCPAWVAARPAIDDKRAPENRSDLLEIQGHVQGALPAARAATVSIKLENGFGSGVIVSKEGLIMTAAHVAGKPGVELTAIFEDGREVKAKALGLQSETDAALIKITEEGEYPYVEYDREDSTRLGDWVFALGHSGGFDKERGVVLRVGRIVRTAEHTMQSDCTLIGGDSGGPLFDLDGRVVGIHSRVGGKLPENLHVPMREFIDNWDALTGGEFIGEGRFASKPKVGKGFLGLLVGARPEGGVVVEEVDEESPAGQAGIRQGDVIRKVNGLPLESREDLQKLLAEKTPGEELELELQRGETTEVIKLKLADRDE